MARKKICVIVNSRANYARIKSFLLAAREHPGIELQLIVGASALLYRFGSAIDVIRADGFMPNSVVHSIVEGETPTTMAKSTGLATVELATHFENLAPDVVLTVADRFETLATAVAASYMNIPVAHTQGGEVTGSIDENVRHAVTKLSHIHFPATDRARDFLIRLGEHPETIHQTGCPSIDLLKDISPTSPVPAKALTRGTGPPLDPSAPYLVVLQHPVTIEYGSGMEKIQCTLDAINTVLRDDLQAIWLWPNVDAGADEVSKGLRDFREQNNSSRVHFFRNFPPEEFAQILNQAQCIVGNSSSGLREASFLGTPCVNIGSRQRGRERADNVVDVPFDKTKIIAAVQRQIARGRYPRSTLFGDGNSGSRIATILAEADISLNKSLTYLRH